VNSSNSDKAGLLFIGVVLLSAGTYAIATSTPEMRVLDKHEHYIPLILSLICVLFGVQAIAFALLRRLAEILSYVYFAAVVVGLLWGGFSSSIHYDHPYAIRTEIVVGVILMLAHVGFVLRKQRREKKDT
jgi:hypothetical protein